MEHFDARDTDSRGGMPRVFADSSYQRGHGIGNFHGELCRKILPYLNKGARAVGKEILHVGINVLENVENNKPLKEAVKSRLAELRDNQGGSEEKSHKKISS